jgi:multisubunit Na+/H+ antiporter MnhB subunit
MKALLGAFSFGLFALMTWVLLDLPPASGGLTHSALKHLPESGVTNPVTAVLLNYRGYDTLLEIAVLLLAVVAVWAIRESDRPAQASRGKPVLSALLRIALPLIVLFSGYLLWIGSFAPGGAFQGGALLGGGLVLLLLVGLRRLDRSDISHLRFALVAGLVVFVAVAGGVMFMTGGLLQYPFGSAGSWILVIESAALLSIALTLAALFAGGRPPHD